MKEIDTLTSKADVIMKWITTDGVDYGMKLVGAIIVLLIGLWVIKIISDRVFKLMDKSNVDGALRSFIKSILTVVLKIVLIISVLSMIGIEMTTFIAMLTAASLAIGLAFRGSLSNFAGGMMILFFKPFKLGDYITAMGHGGTVTEIQIFNTYILTSDNKTVIIPNAHLSDGVLVNNSTQELRRVDWVFGIGYGDNYDTAKEMILGFIKDDKRILNSPAEPFIALHELADSTVNLVVRAWVKSSDYWGVYFSINENYYKNAGKNNINMPFPQMDIHMDKISA